MTIADREASAAKTATWLPYLVDLLRSRFGLVTNEARLAMVQSAAERAASESALSSPVHLLPLLRDGSTEHDAVRALLRHVTIHESYFFRDERAVDALATRILPKLVERRRASRRLRIWSAGCAGGEETYTLSILLRTHCDVEGWDIEILGTDLDRDVLPRAKEAVFTTGSLRTCTDADRERFFEPVDGRRFRLRDRYREGVRFDYDNLMEPTPVSGGGPFDLVMCRNVAIYFDREGIATLHEKIARHLAPDGMALLGLLEPRPTADLVPAEVHDPSLPVYRRADGVRASQRPAAPAQNEPPVRARVEGIEDGALSRARLDAAISRLRPSRPSSRPEPPEARSTSTVVTPPKRPPELDAARTLADDGALDEALRIATKCIEAAPLDPDAYLLASLIADELGRAEQAETLLRRVLYLTPSSAEAHLRLSLLLERRGDRHGASRSMTEAQRLGLGAQVRR
jgi:chemotaxis protein methyltransferase CheR